MCGQRKDAACTGAKKRKGRASKGGGGDAAAPSLPTQNGEGDQLSVSSGILQVRAMAAPTISMVCALSSESGAAHWHAGRAERSARAAAPRHQSASVGAMALASQQATGLSVPLMGAWHRAGCVGAGARAGDRRRAAAAARRRHVACVRGPGLRRGRGGAPARRGGHGCGGPQRPGRALDRRAAPGRAHHRPQRVRHPNLLVMVDPSHGITAGGSAQQLT